MDEVALIRGVAKGDEEALKKLIRLYKDRVFLYVYGLLRNYEDSEEATAETFFQIWRSAKKFKGFSKPSTWIFGVARNVAMNILRKRRKEFKTFELEDWDSPVEDVEVPENVELLRRAIEMLSPAHREVIHLAFYEDMSYSEIAEVLGIPENTVKTRVFHAKKKLRDLVKELENGDKGSS
ncbi:MAG: sigma-70 family RNA polymerase sigma factor [Aquificae bacterium]|nr:sigma-70 family RNA polymerase sigma factor [Aquificota bacterium]